MIVLKCSLFAGERPFECDVCHARFTLKHSMMRHRRKHEGNGGLDDTQSESDEESLGEGTGEVQIIVCFA